MIDQDKIRTYSDIYPNELKSILRYMPKDDLDWALVMYLFRHTSKGNIITLGKISSYFGLDKYSVSERLNNMYWLINRYMTCEYIKCIYIYEISNIGADILLKLIEILEVRASPKKTYKPKQTEKPE